MMTPVDPNDDDWFLFILILAASVTATCLYH